MKHTATILLSALFVSCTSDPCLDTDALSKVAQDSVRERLKSPSTAQFTETKHSISPNGGRQMIEGKVDSQNGFGAMIRSEYWATFDCTDGVPTIHYAALGTLHWGTEHKRQMDSISEAAASEAEDTFQRAIREAEEDAKQ